MFKRITYAAFLILFATFEQFSNLEAEDAPRNLAEFFPTEISQNDITWTFDREVRGGTFVNGDPWVLGPVNIVRISNSRNVPGFPPKEGQNGSVINPRGDGAQGYDSGMVRTYDANLNVGRDVSPEKPLTLRPGDSLVSTVGWVVGEPDCPRMYATGTPRPALKTAAVLTCLGEIPPADSFRPPYCGTGKEGCPKAVRFQKSDVRWELLGNLAPVKTLPDFEALAQSLSRVWLDEVPGWAGAVFHPSENMPNYGRDMNYILIQASLAVHLDARVVPEKERLTLALIQYGIDLEGMADSGSFWPCDGGHGMGRKWPILFAGLMLNDAHMQSVGQWSTRFQEDEQTFYVTPEVIALSRSSSWNPDKRAALVPYSESDLDLPEWGIRHATHPEADNRSWDATYREINNSYLPGFALAALWMNQRNSWNHNAFFDYADRVMAETDWRARGIANRLPPFVLEMWETYRKECH